MKVKTQIAPALIVLPLIATTARGGDPAAPDRKAQYVRAVVTGEGLLGWQEPGVSEAEAAFRTEMETRKDEMLADRTPVPHPVLLTEADLDRLREKIKRVDWAKAWFANQKSAADAVADQPADFVERMIPMHTPTNSYGSTCPNCVGEKSQEAAGSSTFAWSWKNPDVLRCRHCGHQYPSAEYPETARLICPRTGQTFTYYLNEQERAHPEDRSGKYAYHWVGYPVHMSFTGMIRERKIGYMKRALRPLALTYALTGEPRYARRAIEIFTRLAEGYRNWLYHDYWDTIADCDPLYAAWHWTELPLEFKRHLCAGAYARDTVEKARMLQSYWGAGRIHPSTDSVGSLHDLGMAYDLIHNATDEAGRALWTDRQRTKVERDFFLEYLIGAEPFVGGRGKTENVSNKSPRIYAAMAAVAQCLGLAEWADTSLRGYEAVRDRSFNYDGFSHETPAYNNMYLGALAWIPELLHGFRWPGGFAGRSGQVDLYGTDARLRLMYHALIDQLRGDGGYLPLGDSPAGRGPTPLFFEIGVRRYPDLFAGPLPAIYGGRNPGEYAVFHLSEEQVTRRKALDPPEIFFPRWMVAILRNGHGTGSTTLAMSCSPSGGHRHTDSLSLFYVDRGRRVLGDHGYVGDMPVNKWIKDTRSHNLVVVDDQPQRFSQRRTKLAMMLTSPAASVVEATSTAYAQCGVYRRLVILIKGPGSETFALDVFRVTGGKKHAYRVYSELASSDAADDGALAVSGVTLPPDKPLPKVGNSLAAKDIFGLRDVRGADDPPDRFTATWKEKTDAHRVWVLTVADRVEVSNGPGQQSRHDPGRRVRYLDVVRTGDDLSSTFVAVHEPSGPKGNMPIQTVERLIPPASAGPGAVAIRIHSAWGTWLVLNEFDGEAAVEAFGGSVRFTGKIGLVCRRPDGQIEWLAGGAKTLKAADFGFAGKTPAWSGPVRASTSDSIEPATDRPTDWPAMPEGCQTYVIVDDGQFETGLPVSDTGAKRIGLGRFPLPGATRFHLPALRLGIFPEVGLK